MHKGQLRSDHVFKRDTVKLGNGLSGTYYGFKHLCVCLV